MSDNTGDLGVRVEGEYYSLKQVFLELETGNYRLSELYENGMELRNPEYLDGSAERGIAPLEGLYTEEEDSKEVPQLIIRPEDSVGIPLTGNDKLSEVKNLLTPVSEK